MRTVAGIAAVLLLLAIVAAGAWWFLRSDARAPRASVAESRAREADPRPGAGPDPVDTEVAPRRVTLAGGAAAPGSDPEPVAGAVYRASLCGLTGRVVERAGAPVAGVAVTLYGMQRQLLIPLFASMVEGGGAPFRLEHATTRTDADGRFRFEDVEPRGWYLLGVDPAGERGTLRGVSVAFLPGQRADLGDVVLQRGGGFVGRVVDEAGAPLPGATVRWSPLPRSGLLDGLLAARPGSALASEAGWTVVRVPAWLLRVVDRFPAPTTATDADGTFHLANLPDDRGQLVVEREGRAPCWVEGLTVPRVGFTDVGPVVLEPGRTLRVRVVDAKGTPLPSAQVMGGTGDDPAAVLVHEARRRGDHFEVAGLADRGQPFVIARASPRQPWQFAGFVPLDATVTLERPRQVDLWVRGTRGEPVADAEITLLASWSGRSVSLAALAPAAAREATIALVAEQHEEVEPGHHRLHGLAPGTYGLLVQAEAGAAFEELVVEPDQDRMLTVRLQPTRPLVVQVVGPDGDPVSDARVTVTGWDQARTGPDGVARLPRVSVTGDGSFIDVLHPAYAKFQGVLSRMTLAEEAPHVTIPLASGGGLSLRVSDGGHAPPNPYLVVLGPLWHGQAAFDELFPFLAHTDADGAVRWSHLTPGSYRIEVHPGRTEVPALAALFGPPEGGGEEVTTYVHVSEGETTECHVDVQGPGLDRPTELTGRVLVNGVAKAGLRVEVSGSVDAHEVTDGSGGFDFGFVAPGAATLTVRDASISPGPLYTEDMGLPAGGRRRVEVDLTLQQVVLRVVGDGEPAAHAELDVEGNGFSSPVGMTGADGTATFPVPGPGRYRCRAGHATLGFADQEIDVPPGRPLVEVTVTLHRGVPCAGRIEGDLEVRRSFGDARRSLVLFDQDYARSRLAPVDDEGCFRVPGMLPGRYHAVLFGGPRVTFDLPPQGSTDLVLDFTAQR